MNARIQEIVAQSNKQTFGAYGQQPDLIGEHYGIEQHVLAGGYGYRQVLELVQNAADAILEAHKQGNQPPGGNRVQVVLRDSHLYVANTGGSLTERGLKSLLLSHYSPKRGDQIGRFGLAFKSLLRLGGRIDLFTKGAGALRFDPERCRRELQERFNVKDAPGLRLAYPLDEGELAGDAVLRELTWAETIVRADIRAADFVYHLRDEISSFPSEFLLFLQVPMTLQLDDGAKPVRELKVETAGAERALFAGEEQSRWHVASREVAITDERAREDATDIHARESVRLAWAILLEGKREEIGRFWAFFPTDTPTYLSGILNAPWKLNSDRKAIIGGEWNTALMSEAARLIVETLPQLRADADPARTLDAFPRQLERKGEVAAPLVEAIWGPLETAAVIPDATGTLRTARELWCHPRETAELARQWQALAGADELARMVHPSCLERQRGSRLNALAERLKPQGTEQPSCPNLRMREASDWFASVASADVDKTIKVLKLAEGYADDCSQSEWNTDRESLAIIPSDDGQLLTANKVVFAPEGTPIPDGRHPVARSLCEVVEAKRILTDVMKVKPLDDSVWESVLDEALKGAQYCRAEARDAGWQKFWARLRAAPPAVRQQFITQNSDEIRVRRRDGEWVLANAVLLPGTLVGSDDTSANQNVLVDSGTHDADGALLAALGVCDFPDGVVAVVNHGGLSEWVSHWRSYYLHNVNGRASWDYLKLLDLKFPKGWAFLPKLSGIPNGKLTERFLSRIGQGEFVEKLKFGHSTMKSYQKIDVPHPLPWFLLKHGTVQVGDETVRLSALVERRHEPALVKWDRLQPALEKLEGATPPVTATQADIRALWLALIKVLATPGALADDSLRDLWAGAAKDAVVPESLRREVGVIPLAQVFVTGSPDLAQRARKGGHLAVTLDERALNLWIERGARDLAELMSPGWTEQTGPVGLLVSTVPELAEVLRDEVKDNARCQPVAGLKLVVAGNADVVPCLMRENTLLLDLAQLASLSRADRLQCLLAEVAAAGWLKTEPGEALRILGDAQVDVLRAKVAQGSTLAERLLLAVGNREDPLREALGNLAGMDFIQRCESLRLAELTLAQLGPATLTTLKDTLLAEGLNPPSRWNTAEARAFVASIGFPEEFATSPESRRESEEFISGPIELPPLHDFQEEVLEGIQALVASGTTRRRAVVSLPTGGGKTLVTVEAAVLLVLKPESDRRRVIWVAQTDELCEQAVQAFRQVWLNLGAQRTDLRIVRLWDRNPNPAIQEADKPVLVVASIQTLNNRMEAEELMWLKQPGLVVVDECHHAITPSYTKLFRWLNAEAPRPGAPPKDEPPILGLSATPFRTDDKEAQRLARRFDNRWLPGNQEHLHVRLRRQGVLAEVNSEALDSGVGLLQEEIDRLSQLPEPWEGIDFENLIEAINQRLGGSKQRNEFLVELIKAAKERSVLFFANSVLHAEEMSARLNLQGIPTAAVSGETPTAARRYFLERFQRGEIRVLCNHSVLSGGFDAPKTDMVLIARQVFSPVRYMQMVGRGLRGEKNGGKARCRLVTVMDNLGRFQDKHPYHYCQRYFSELTESQ
jgi:superfamily II DNA or RNA helicase